MATQSDMSPADDFFAITPDDGNDLAKAVRGLIVASGGTLKLTTVGGTTVTLTVPAGVLPIKARRVWSAGTTASGFTGLV